MKSFGRKPLERCSNASSRQACWNLDGPLETRHQEAKKTTYKAKTEIFEKREVAAVDEGRTPAQELNSVIGKRR